MPHTDSGDRLRSPEPLTGILAAYRPNWPLRILVLLVGIGVALGGYHVWQVRQVRITESEREHRLVQAVARTNQDLDTHESEIRRAIIKRIAIVDMTRSEVRAAKGEPDMVRTRDQLHPELQRIGGVLGWVYEVGDEKWCTVIFDHKGLVIYSSDDVLASAMGAKDRADRGEIPP